MKNPSTAEGVARLEILAVLNQDLDAVIAAISHQQRPRVELNACGVRNRRAHAIDPTT